MSEARSPQLEASIAEAPGDTERYRVYADWLLARGNVRGRLAHVQLEIEHRPDPELLARERELFERHPTLLVDEPHASSLSPQAIDRLRSEARWRGGFLCTLESELDPASLAALLAGPSARLLQSLHVRGLGVDPIRHFEPALESIEHTRLIGLRRLVLGAPPCSYLEWRCYAERTCRGLHRLADACPRLRELVLMAPNFDFGRAESDGAELFPRLVELDARLGATNEAIASLSRVTLPSLETLQLGTSIDDPVSEGARVDDDWSPWTVESLAGLLDGQATPKLRRLVLWNLLTRTPESELPAYVRASSLGRRVELELCVDTMPDDVDDDDGLYHFMPFGT